MPDTYRKLAHDMMEAIADSVGELQDSGAGEWFSDRLRALDEAGPYGYVVQQRFGTEPDWGGGLVVTTTATLDELRQYSSAAIRFCADNGTTVQRRIIPLYAGTPEEVDDE